MSPVADSCRHGKKSSGCITVESFIDQLSDYQLLKGMLLHGVSTSLSRDLLFIRCGWITPQTLVGWLLKYQNLNIGRKSSCEF
jgi:hypothetical protein